MELRRKWGEKVEKVTLYSEKWQSVARKWREKGE